MSYAIVAAAERLPPRHYAAYSYAASALRYELLPATLTLRTTHVTHTLRHEATRCHYLFCQPRQALFYRRLQVAIRAAPILRAASHYAAMRWHSVTRAAVHAGAAATLAGFTALLRHYTKAT